MEDKELIELAAKAAGLHVKVSSNSGRGLKVHGNCNWWNPLTDDGDAFRLAVRLNLLYGKVLARSVTENHEEGDDIYAATRRAITRASAQIGKEME